MSYEERELYYRSIIEAHSDSDEGTVFGVDDDEINEDYVPNEADVNSDAEVGEFEVEINQDLDHEEIDEAEEDEGNDEMPTGPSDNTFFDTKDGVKWYTQPPPLNRQAARNIIRESAFMGPNPITKNLSKVDTFTCIMSSAMRHLICRYSNKKAEARYAQWNAQNPHEQPRTWKPITDNEFSAFLGILLITGCHKSSQEPVSELWEKNAYPLYRATMARNRFTDILRFIRFDWHATRGVRKAEDKAAPIRDIFDMMNCNLRTHYRPYECVTVNEQLFGYRGRTSFTQYMPSKPTKYGIKIWWVCDSATYYPLQGQIYTGKINNVRDVNQGERIVKDLVANYRGTGRNVTMDSFFTTLPLVKELSSWNLTGVGTVKKTKGMCPPSSNHLKLGKLHLVCLDFLIMTQCAPTSQLQTGPWFCCPPCTDMQLCQEG